MNKLNIVKAIFIGIGILLGSGILPARVIASETKQSLVNAELRNGGDCFASLAMTLSDRLLRGNDNNRIHRIDNIIIRANDHIRILIINDALKPIIGDPETLISTPEKPTTWQRWVMPMGITIGAGMLVYYIYNARGR